VRGSAGLLLVDTRSSHREAAQVRADLAELAGGAEPIAARARAHLDAGRPVEALHLIDVALAAEPANPAGRAVKLDALKALQEQAGGENLSETMWLRSEIAALEGPQA